MIKNNIKYQISKKNMEQHTKNYWTEQIINNGWENNDDKQHHIKNFNDGWESKQQQTKNYWTEQIINDGWGSGIEKELENWKFSVDFDDFISEKKEDIIKKCFKCEENFIFSVYRQQLYEKRKWCEPKMCRDCNFKKFKKSV